MSLTAVNLVGYMQAEYNKASRYRIALVVVQLGAALPAAISVVIPYENSNTLYVLAIVGAAMLVIWWALSSFYVAAQEAAGAARRSAMLLGGLGQQFSPSELRNLRETFTVSAEVAKTQERDDYYDTTEPAGASRLAEMLEESALYSEDLQRTSANVLVVVFAFFAVLFLVVALASLPIVDRQTGYVIVRVFFAVVVFLLSADMFGAFRAHRAAARKIRDIRQRLEVADRSGYPHPDVLLAFADYTAAVEGAPESVPFAYKLRQKSLDQRWKDYRQDRAAEREARQ